MSVSPKLCGVCLEEYNESERCPRILNCSHTFCSDCIGNLISNNKKQCPFCRKRFEAKSINDFMINYAALDLIKYLTEQGFETTAANRSGSSSRSSKVEKIKKEGLEDNRVNQRDCQEARQQIEAKLGEIKDLECTIGQENSKIEKEILPKIQAVILRNSRTLEELKETRIQFEDQMKEIGYQQEILDDVKQKIQATAETCQGVGKILDEAEVSNASFRSKIEEIQVIISNVEKALALKQKRVMKEREISNVMLDLLSSSEENSDFVQIADACSTGAGALATRGGIITQRTHNTTVSSRDLRAQIQDYLTYFENRFKQWQREGRCTIQ